MFNSEKDRYPTAKTTTNPPMIVYNVGVSLIKSQTQIGLKANSKSIKSVNSAAKRNFEARIKVTLTQVDKMAPYKKHRNRSRKDIFKFPG
jgi:hypothetical protein